MSADRFPLRSVSLELLSFSVSSVDSALVIHVHWFFLGGGVASKDAGVTSEKHEWEREARISAPHGDARIRRFAGSVDGVDAIVSRSCLGQADAVFALAFLVLAVSDAVLESVVADSAADIDVSRDSRIAAPAVETIESTLLRASRIFLAVLLAVAVVVARSHVLVLVFVLLVAVLVVLVRAVLTVPVSTVVLVLAEDCPEQHATEKLHPST